MHRPLSALAASLVLACGGSDTDAAAAPPPAAPSGAPADARLAGTWAGGVAVTGAGVSVTYTTTLAVAVSGETATVSGVCPSGTEAITAQASGDSAEWRGRVSCPPMVLPACTVSLTYLTTSLRVNADGTLSASGSGAADACGGEPVPVTFSFTGAK